MTTANSPSDRADAIFDALDVSETEEQAKEAVELEEKVQRMVSVQERVAQDMRRRDISTSQDDKSE
jgi:hypothetical protein